MTAQVRRYVSPRREAQVAATREAILEAFADQLSVPGNDQLSPSQAAEAAGVSVRTVHAYFPNRESQISALAEWFDSRIFVDRVVAPEDPDDLPRYFRDIQRMALATPASRALSNMASRWPELRQERRRDRIESVREVVASIGAPADATDDATAVLLRLSGVDAAWPMHDLYGLPLDRVPDAIAHTVELIVADLRAAAAR